MDQMTEQPAELLVTVKRKKKGVRAKWKKIKEMKDKIMKILVHQAQKLGRTFPLLTHIAQPLKST